MEGQTILKLPANAVRSKVIEQVEYSKCSTASRSQFLSVCLPEPEPGLVRLDEFHARLPNQFPGTYAVWFITRGSPQSVFFDECVGLFGCCWGPDRDTGEYSDLGYRSQDPVEMSLV